ncbi:MAG: HAMP domain-containing histidine kinase [Acidobacteria bacterium]|nr:HAMP domain-containing histidine kinase [Acidobacteriota bacterium]
MNRLLAAALIVGVMLSVGLLVWLDHLAVSGWQSSAASLAQRRASETADLLIRALNRDMRGAQTSVLLSPRWNEFMLIPPYDVRTVVASAFARYPYPESFFALRETRPRASLVFFNRPGRSPKWMPLDGMPTHFPVAVVDSPSGADGLIERIRVDVRQRRTFSIFEITLGGIRYQVVARLLYRDAVRNELLVVFGFTVDLEWVRHWYFQELIKQVSRISAAEGRFDLAIFDSSGRPVAGTPAENGKGAVIRRSFPMMFFDPTLVELDPPADLGREAWTVKIGIRDDPTLAEAVRAASRTRVVAAIAAIALGVGLALTIRAARTSSKLAEMRSEFVSTVTHELKTPVASIRAIGDTLVSGRISGETGPREYARLLVQESKRLGRLIENLLAFARVTDVTEVYAFESLDIETIVDNVLKNFQAQLIAADFKLIRDIPPLPPVRGDGNALELMLDNLVDNAIRYSQNDRHLVITANLEGQSVALSVVDRGMGIPAEELDKVTRRFFRGKRAGSGGSGLGLAIVQRIVQDHGGFLSVQSEVGSGTTVTVKLPVNDANKRDWNGRRS